MARAKRREWRRGSWKRLAGESESRRRLCRCATFSRRVASVSGGHLCRCVTGWFCFLAVLAFAAEGSAYRSHRSYTTYGTYAFALPLSRVVTFAVAPPIGSVFLPCFGLRPRAVHIGRIRPMLSHCLCPGWSPLPVRHGLVLLSCRVGVCGRGQCI